jgi:hypothetical protein
MTKTYEKIVERGSVIATKHYGKKGTEEDTEFEELEVRVFDVEPAHVRINVGFTVNLGNYNSGRVDTAVTLPCYVEEIDEALEEATDIAGKKSAQLVKEVEEFATTGLAKALKRR